MKTGKHIENALREAYSIAVYNIQLDDEEIQKITSYHNEYKKKLEDAQKRRSEELDRKFELRTALLELGVDPEKEV